jgi:hypothetical protein
MIFHGSFFDFRAENLAANDIKYIFILCINNSFKINYSSFFIKRKTTGLKLQKGGSNSNSKNFIAKFALFK